MQTYLEIADELSLIIEHGRLRLHALAGAQNLRMVLHDLKTPLSVIQGFLDIATEEDWYDQLEIDAKNLFSVLRRNTNYIHDLLNELGEISQLNPLSKKLDVKVLSLRGFVAELAVRGRELTEKKNIAFSIATVTEMPEKVRIDAPRILRVFDNLITNAVKYSARGTAVLVSLRQDGQRLIFEVRDEGQGIPKTEYAKLFREFGKTSVQPTEGETVRA